MKLIIIYDSQRSQYPESNLIKPQTHVEHNAVSVLFIFLQLAANVSYVCGEGRHLQREKETLPQ